MSTAKLALNVPVSRDTVLFNLGAPFRSQFLSSKRWYIDITVNNAALSKTSKATVWKAPALFHRRNWSKPVQIPLSEAVGKGNHDIGIRLDIMEEVIHLKLNQKETVPVVPSKKTTIRLPSYFLLPEGFREIPPRELSVHLTPRLEIVKEGGRSVQLE
ncbi:MAG: hypothetical protein GY940_21310, partial [bacterium]|nr:hypothetical protein [bacterium]